jgi:hypothetical protein
MVRTADGGVALSASTTTRHAPRSPRGRRASGIQKNVGDVASSPPEVISGEAMIDASPAAADRSDGSQAAPGSAS